MLAVRGVIDKRPGSEEANLIVNELIPLEELPPGSPRGWRPHRRNEARRTGPRAAPRNRARLSGQLHFQFVLALADGSQVFCDCDGVKVELDAEMRTRIEELLGPGNFRCWPPRRRPRPRRTAAGMVFGGKGRECRKG